MEPVATVLLCALFVLLFICYATALSASGLFNTATRYVVAACIALLSLLSLSGLGVSDASTPAGSPTPPTAEPGRWALPQFILLPYAVLALSILFVVLLLFRRWLLSLRAVRWITGAAKRLLETTSVRDTANEDVTSRTNSDQVTRHHEGAPSEKNITRRL